jgi:hypothetical protein
LKGNSLAHSTASPGLEVIRAAKIESEAGFVPAHISPQTVAIRFV